MNGLSVDLAVVSGAIQRQPSLYKGVRGVKVGTDISGRYFTAVLLDTEGDCYGWSAVVCDVHVMG
jgi:hypothetical protein